MTSAVRQIEQLVKYRLPGAWCNTEKAAPTRHRPERQHNARSNRRKQCSPNETKPYSKPTLPRKRQTTPTNGHTPRRWKPTHTRLTYTRIRPDAPSHQAGDQYLVPAHTERHNPPRLRTQRQSGSPPASCQLTGPWCHTPCGSLKLNFILLRF